MLTLASNGSRRRVHYRSGVWRCYSSALGRVILVDLETTGFSVKRDRIIEIAALEHGHGGRQFAQLVHPQRYLPLHISRLTGIFPAHLKDMPAFNVVGNNFVQWVKSLNDTTHDDDDAVTLVMHNGRRFDAPFLLAEMERHELAMPRNWQFVDSLEVTRTLLPNHEKGHSLSNLARTFAAKNSEVAHRALGDCRVLANVLTSVIKERGEPQDWKSFVFRMSSSGASSSSSSSKPSKPSKSPPPTTTTTTTTSTINEDEFDGAKLSPMLKHYVHTKAEHQGRLLLYRVGDFFEAFMQDAYILSRVLNIVLTTISGGKQSGRIPMAGFPHHSLDTHMKRLIDAGFSVAICDQVEDASDVKGRIVRREVTRVVTPGTVVDEEYLDPSSNNYIACITYNPSAPQPHQQWGLAHADVSTGEFRTCMTDARGVTQELLRLRASEVIVPPQHIEQMNRELVLSGGGQHLVLVPSTTAAAATVTSTLPSDDDGENSGSSGGGGSNDTVVVLPTSENVFDVLHNEELLFRYYGMPMSDDHHATPSTSSSSSSSSPPPEAPGLWWRAVQSGVNAKSLGAHVQHHTDTLRMQRGTPGLHAASSLLRYILDSHKSTRAVLLRPLLWYNTSNFVILDDIVQRNLELVRTMRGGKKQGSLLWAMDRTVTSMGARMLRSWLLRPLKSPQHIERRQNAIEVLLEHHEARMKLQTMLRRMCDVERITSRCAAGRASARDLLALSRTLRALPELMNVLKEFHRAPEECDELQLPVRLEILSRMWHDFASAVSLGDKLAAWVIDHTVVADTTANTATAIGNNNEGAEEDEDDDKDDDDDDDAKNTAATYNKDYIIATGVHEELDRLRDVESTNKQWLQEYVQEQRAAIGVASLKIAYTRALGFYLALSRSQIRKGVKVPEYTRVATLTNEERYTTAALRQRETEILQARAKAERLDVELFESLRDEVAANAHDMFRVAQLIATTDTLAGLAQLALDENYVRPIVTSSSSSSSSTSTTSSLLSPQAASSPHNNTGSPYHRFRTGGSGVLSTMSTTSSFNPIHNSNINNNNNSGGGGMELCIVDGRHPVVEQTLDTHNGDYIPNSCFLGIRHMDDMNSSTSNVRHPLFQRGVDVAVLTGPNAAGKSCYLRQIGLMMIMAHMGSYVPARYMRTTVCDRIMVRAGAVDDLAGGRSTFVVEMGEVADILRNASSHSLVLMDEIGRGTSTTEGLALAQAIVEHLALTVGARCILATHYHELNRLTDHHTNIGNLHLTASTNADGQMVFHHRVQRGGTHRSYGIEISQLAGLPPSVVHRATELAAATHHQQQQQQQQHHQTQ